MTDSQNSSQLKEFLMATYGDPRGKIVTLSRDQETRRFVDGPAICMMDRVPMQRTVFPVGSYAITYTCWVEAGQALGRPSIPSSHDSPEARLVRFWI